MSQTTLILLKPDCVEKKFCGNVISRFENAGYTLCAMKMLSLDKELLSKHYAPYINESFYPKLEEFMLSGPVIAIVLSGENVIAGVRAMLGPTDSTKAPAGTIRGDLGENNRVNVIHASDSPESAEAEVARFFRPEEIVR